MSTGLECEFVWVNSTEENGSWYYVLQDWSCPVEAWDWREYATAYGPFRSEEAANNHLQKNHANPGGYSFDMVPRDREDMSDILRDLLEKARK